jgi:type IV secretory pathway TraG/TraD family ATPase VirD4
MDIVKIAIDYVNQDPGTSMTVAAVVVGFGIVAWSGRGAKKGRLASAKFGGAQEKQAARKLTLKQMKERKKNAVSLYVGRQGDGQPMLCLPDAQKGIAVCGAPGSGKTFSVIDPAIRSAINQGIPLVVYDFKYRTQAARIAAYAAKHGYDIRIFAPGYPESDVCNPLDFLRDETDAETAGQMASVMNLNFKTADSGKEDPFFTNAGDKLVEAVFLAAKASPYPDIMMCQAILSLTNLPARIEAAKQLNPWIRASFAQLISTKESEKTVASIVATAADKFTRFIKKNILPAFTGKSTLPIEMQGKQLLIIGMDRERRNIVSPLIATVLHMIVTRNTVIQRKDPLVLALDELPTLYLPSLVEWINESREDGLVCLLGFQNLAQLENRYGKERARSLLGACGTKCIFNPQDYESAKTFSEYLGEEEIRYKSKGTSSSSKSGPSTSFNEQDKTRKLYEPSRFLKLPTGKAVLISPGYANAQEASLPIEQRIIVPKADIAAMAWSEKVWPKILENIIARNGRSLVETPDAELVKRREAAEKLFPLPQQQSKQGGGALPNTWTLPKSREH